MTRHSLPKAGPRISGPIAFAAGALALLAIVPALGGLAAAAPAAASSPPTALASQWAYGAQHWVNVSGVAGNGSATFSIHAFFGWQVLLSQTNTSASVRLLEAQRTTAASFQAQYCRPGCAAPVASATVTEKAWEVATSFANVTTAGNVTVHGAQVPALALMNASSSLRANLTESFAVSATGMMGGLHNASGNLSVAVSSQAHVDFTPALGLLPLNLSGISQWNSTSEFEGGASYLVAYAFDRTPMTGVPIHGGATVPGSVNGSGSLSLNGHTLGPVRLSDGWQTTGVALEVVGPFSLREGFMLVPTGADLFSGSPHPWSGEANGDQTATTSAVDFDPRAPHVGFLASASSYAPFSTSAGVTQAVQVASASPVPSAESTGPQIVQAQPESYATAQQGAQCLLGSCPGGGGGGPLRGGPLGLLLVGLAVLGLVVAVVALVAARRGGPRAPMGPSYSAYRPAAGPESIPPTPAPAPGSPVPPDGPDPLDHLW